MTDETFAQIMSALRESSGVEFKGPGLLSDSRLVAQTVKAVLGMANRRGGGAVIIGVRETANSFVPVGLTDDELRSWNFDATADQIARYADPAVAFSTGNNALWRKAVCGYRSIRIFGYSGFVQAVL